MMVLPRSLIMKFWDWDREQDARRMAQQEYPSGLTEHRDIPYLDDGHIYHKLDVYYPEKTKKKEKLPVIIDIHGGGWFYGDKELNKNYCLHLAQKGFCVFNLSYRLAPEVKADEQLSDCMEALHFIGKHMDEYPADRKHVYVTGDSAGGQLAAYVTAASVSEKMRKAFGKLPEPGFQIKAVSLVSPCPYLNPKGLMKLYLPHVVGKKYRKKEWAKYLDFDFIAKETKGDYPPAIIFTSFADIIAKGQSKRAYKALKKNGTKVVFDSKFNPKLNHVYQVLFPDEENGAKAIDRMVKFFHKNR